jgi:hypothetical protein
MSDETIPEEITGHGAATIKHRASGTEDPDPDDDTPPVDPYAPPPDDDTPPPDDDTPPSDDTDDDDDDENAEAKPFKVLAAEYAGQVVARDEGPVKAVVEEEDGTIRTIPGAELKED